MVGNAGAFAAVKDDGSVVTWGEGNLGGDPSIRLMTDDGPQHSAGDWRVIRL